jgi:hypothetical protein
MENWREDSARAFRCNKSKNYPQHLLINLCVLAVSPVDLCLVLSANVAHGGWLMSLFYCCAVMQNVKFII